MTCSGACSGCSAAGLYYNLYNWYRLIAMLPGYTSNRGFMEQMMGVREPMPDEIVRNLTHPGWRGRLRDRMRFVGSAGTLMLRYLTLRRTTRRFEARLEATLAPSSEAIQGMNLNELAAEYRRLERALLTRWDAPLINDFFTMICFGLLRRSAQQWGGEQGWAQVGPLLGGAAGMISAEPARQIDAMGRCAATIDRAAEALCAADPARVREMLAAQPVLHRAIEAYLARFGDRCMEELKLEAATLHEDPAPLWRAVGQSAIRARAGQSTDDRAPHPRGQAWRKLQAMIGNRPVRRTAMRVLIAAARRHLALRENLRFQRTRVFGRVRRIVVQMGEHLTAMHRIDRPEDVFYLQIDELLGFIEGGVTCTDLQALAATRRAVFERYAEQPAPPERFETRGPAHLGEAFDGPTAREPASRTSVDRLPGEHADDASVLHGTGCYPGVVRGVVRCVVDARSASPAAGHILVAERADPGWVMLLPGAAGVLVQRGSVLSHAATLAREMGIPTIVSLAGLIDQLQDGDLVEMDGAAGTVRLVERPASSAPTSRRNAG